jgi:hypothetical protein
LLILILAFNIKVVQNFGSGVFGIFPVYQNPDFILNNTGLLMGIQPVAVSVPFINHAIQSVCRNALNPSISLILTLYEF